MITLQQIEARPSAPVEATRTPALARAILHLVLFVTIVISPIVLIEPSPYEFAMLALTGACVIAGVRVDRKLLPVIVLLILWNFGGVVALLPVLDDGDAVKFIAISLFMMVNGITFAFLFADDSMRRLKIMRRAYILAAIIAASAGIAGYFHLFPGAGMFTLNDRAAAPSRIRTSTGRS